VSRKRTTDVSQSPTTPQYPLGVTADEAKLAAEIANSPIAGPGGIVERLSNQQWSLPRSDNPTASPDATISRDGHGTQNG
jgi:hypothetical protein